MRHRKDEPQPIGRCQEKECFGQLYPHVLPLHRTPSDFEMMHTPIGPRRGGSRRGPDTLCVGFACNICGRLYAHVPDSHANELEMARRLEVRAVEQKALQERHDRAGSQLAEVFAGLKVNVTPSEISELTHSILDESCQPVVFEECAPESVAGMPLDPAEIDRAIEGIGVWRKFGDAALPVVLDWRDVDEAAIARFSSRIVRFLVQAGVPIRPNVSIYDLRGYASEVGDDYD